MPKEILRYHVRFEEGIVVLINYFKYQSAQASISLEALQLINKDPRNRGKNLNFIQDLQLNQLRRLQKLYAQKRGANAPLSKPINLA